MNSTNNDTGLSRKDKLKQWRAERGRSTVRNTSKSGINTRQPSAATRAGSGDKENSGVLVERPANRTHKRPAARENKAFTRKPFHVDPAVVREASERRVAPGTPINMLKKRIKRAKAASSTSVNQAKVEPNNSRRANDKGAAAKGQGGGAVTVHAHPGLGRAARMKQGPARPALSLSLDAAKMKQVSDYLKSQIGEAHMLLEIAGIDAARTLLADLLSCSGDGRGVGELALYWAARAKLEEDAGLFLAARRTLDEGQIYVSMPMQQKVLQKVVSAFETRMNDRAEVEVSQLLNSSGSSNGSRANSPTSSTPLRYDPNDLSMEDDVGGSSNVGSAIKNLNFSRIACATDSADRAKRRGSREHREQPEEQHRVERSTSSESGAAGLKSASAEDASGLDAEQSGVSSGGVLHGVVYSDDDSDLGIGEFDELIAKAKAFTEEEQARSARFAKEHAQNSASDEADLLLSDDTSSCREQSKEIKSSSNSANGSSEKSKGKKKTRLSSGTAMPPPQTRPSGKRKGTPHPKRNTPTGPDGKDIGDGPSEGGSFIAQVEAKGKDGNRTLTPVRRSRRFSISKEPTPSPLRKEMEALL
ncbi:unnamed protein product [Sphacelaria rigidula]